MFIDKFRFNTNGQASFLAYIKAYMLWLMMDSLDLRQKLIFYH